MPESKLQQKLVDYIQDAHAMETDVMMMLDSMIGTTEDADIRRSLEHHKEETQEQKTRLESRLRDLGVDVSARKEGQSVIAAMGKALLDFGRGDKAGKNARDAYATEHLEIAAYSLLESLARVAGDDETVEIAIHNRREEEKMAREIEKTWDRVVELTLKENDIRVPAGAR
jgi:ferritin-like metal-binding protein YciE